MYLDVNSIGFAIAVAVIITFLEKIMGSEDE
jgi:hypothetical protein